MYLIGGFGRIVDYKRGRQSAAKEQPHREVGTQSLRTSGMRWPGYPRYRRLRKARTRRHATSDDDRNLVSSALAAVSLGVYSSRSAEDSSGRMATISSARTTPTAIRSRLFASLASLRAGRPRSEYPPPLSTRSTKLPPDTSTSTSRASRSFMTLELLPEAE